ERFLSPTWKRPFAFEPVSGATTPSNVRSTGMTCVGPRVRAQEAGSDMTELRSAKDAIECGRAHGADMADLRSVDMPGIWQHTSIPFGRVDEALFEDGLFFDGSSVRGFQPINASDMLIIPIAASAKMDPFTRHPTIVFVCDIADPITKEPYGRDPRYI